MENYKIDSSHVIKKITGKNVPVLRVKSGSTIEFETKNCFGGQLLTPGDGPLVYDAELAGNPATGPVYVEEAEIGDVLKVEVLEIIPVSDAVMGMGMDMGVFMNEMEHEALRIYPVRDGKTFFDGHCPIENKPMLGVIGTTLEEGQETDTLTPGKHGGNMDCRRITAGSTVYLPVNAEGALLAIGDVHAVMGDGEVSSGGAEVNANVKVRVTVVKGEYFECPMVISEGYAMTIYSALTLDEAADEATKAMQRFLQAACGLPYIESCMLLSLVGDLRICQIVDPKKTCRMEVPLKIFETYGYKFK